MSRAIPDEIQIYADGQMRLLKLSAEQRRQRVHATLYAHQLPLNTRCGGKGVCDGCMVQLVRGELIHAPRGRRAVANGAPITVRACEYTWGDGSAAEIHIPDRSRTAYQPQVLTDFHIRVPYAHQPLCDLDGIDQPVGAAIDVGTTTVVLLLVDLRDGRILSRASAFNRQMDLGDDVVTRINLCRSDASMLPRLHEAVLRDTIAVLIREALEKAGVSADRLACITAAGNTTMQHLLAGVDPSPLGVHPFTPQFLDHHVIQADGLGAPLHLLPGTAAYVGADVTAGVVSSGLVYDDGPSLLVDVGTNGEIVLKHGDHLLACATAAGPAFEGAGLTHGIRAGDGAISHLQIHTNPLRIEIEVIGNAKPLGICGSAYVDLLAKGVATGLLDTTGRFNRQCPGIERLLCQINGQPALRLARGRGSEPICVTEYDLSRLLQAKAAIAAGILTLLGRAKLTPADIRTVYLAGGFGMHMKTASAIGCGLLPGFRLEQIELVGNTSLAGALATLLDRMILHEITRVSRRIETIELNLEPTFEDHYIDQLLLPSFTAEDAEMK